MSVLLEVKGLHVNYGKSEALRGISFRVDKGEVVALVGANGAGKTSTMKSLSGLIVPLAGEIWFHGQRIDRTPAHDRVRLGIAHIPEGRRVFGALSVRQNLQMGAYTRHEKKAVDEDIEKIYTTFPALREKATQPAQALSGGQQQMLAIARALMSRPQLLLMDEPSLGLSPIVVKEVARIITRISKEGVSVVLVEQNALLALRISSRAYVLEVGNIVLEGDSKDLLNNETLIEAYLGI
jgi:branched-chain amino acid transport system ATP-binding protein